MDAETESDKKSWIGWCQPKKALSAKIGAMPLAVYVIAADAKSAVRLIEARLTIEYSDKHLSTLSASTLCTLCSTT